MSKPTIEALQFCLCIKQLNRYDQERNGFPTLPSTDAFIPEGLCVGVLSKLLYTNSRRSVFSKKWRKEMLAFTMWTVIVSNMVSIGNEYGAVPTATVLPIPKWKVSLRWGSVFSRHPMNAQYVWYCLSPRVLACAQHVSISISRKFLDGFYRFLGCDTVWVRTWAVEASRNLKYNARGDSLPLEVRKADGTSSLPYVTCSPREVMWTAKCSRLSNESKHRNRQCGWVCL